MGVLKELDYEIVSANAIQKVTQRVASSRPGAWVFQRTLYPLDKVLYNATKGRLTVPGLMAGLPVIMLTTTGAKSGQQRTMPLLGIPLGEDMAVIGSNYGQKSTPGWVYNLRSNPEATLGYQAKEVAVRARPATDEETEQAFEAGSAFYDGYDKYRARADHREIEVFILESA